VDFVRRSRGHTGLRGTETEGSHAQSGRLAPNNRRYLCIAPCKRLSYRVMVSCRLLEGCIIKFGLRLTAISVAISFASIGLSVSLASASLASACANGRMCLSSTVTMDSADVLNTTSFSIGGIFPNDQNWSARSFGNKQISRCARFSEDVIMNGSHVLVVRAIANYNTGNNFGGGLQNLDTARSTAGAC
jgi:hypothetical protein